MNVERDYNLVGPWTWRVVWCAALGLALALACADSAEAQPADKITRSAISTAPPSAECDEATEVGRLYLDTDADTNGSLYFCTGAGGWKDIDDDGGAGGGAPTDASYVTLGTNATLTDERVFTDGNCIDSTDGGAGGNLTVAVGTCSSANVATAVTDETGTGALVLAGSPALTGSPTIDGNNICESDGTNCPGSSSTIEYHPDNHPPAANVFANDEFTGGAFALTWTAGNMGGGDTWTANAAHDAGILVIANTAAGGVAMRGQWTPLPSSGDWLMVMKNTGGICTSADCECGLWVLTGGSVATPSEIYTMGFGHSGADYRIVWRRLTAYTTVASTSTLGLQAESPQITTRKRWLAMRWTDSSDALEPYYSWDGRVFYPFAGVTEAAISDGGVYCNSEPSTISHLLYAENFRIMDANYLEVITTGNLNVYTVGN